MNPSSKTRRFRSIYTASATALFEPMEHRQMFAAFTVTNVDDSGAGSLRQAIIDANATANVGGPDEIGFAIAGDGLHTIEPLTELPAIIDPLVIDGYTQDGAAAN